VIIAGARRFAEQVAANKTEPRFIPMAKAWLFQRRWEDAPDVTRQRREYRP